ncbi:MAG: hypothetical protein ABSF98_20170 [Bryobacteraceae bacterium]
MLALIMFISSARAADMAGHYAAHNVMEVGTELLLKPDGTFEFGLAYGAADYYAKGTWRAEGGSVFLTTAGKEEPPFRLTRSEATKTPGTRVWVKAPGGQPIPDLDVVIDTPAGKTAARTTDTGAAEFADKTGARSALIRVEVYQLEAGPFTLNPAHNDFYFEINGDAITRVQFKDERLKIDGTTLVMTHFGADHPLRYEKQ